jgi:hypothetical protein
MTNQEAFDIVWHKFVVEGAPASINDFGECQYGPPDTTGCAVACLIDNWDARQYLHDNETQPLSVILDSCPYPLPAGLKDNPSILAVLRSCHDRAARDTVRGYRDDQKKFTDDIRRRLTKVAFDLGLMLGPEPEAA